MISKKSLLKSIEELLALCESNYNGNNDVDLDNSYYKTLSILKYFGEDDQRTLDLVKEKAICIRSHRSVTACTYLNSSIMGILSSLRFEVKNNLIKTLTSSIQGQLYGDFIVLSKTLLQQGNKESAAVLACGALEDCMKRFAIVKGLDVEEKDLTTIVNSLKSKGLIKGPQSSLVQSFIQIRNKAFHAQFEKIEPADINSLIAFVESFLLTSFK